MPDLKDQNELDAYYLADPLHPRAAAVMWPVIVEKRIDKLFELALRPDQKVKDELLRPSGALGNYAVKVQLAYLLGWFGEDIFKDLLTISKIRNRFAHNIEVKDFSDQQIAAWLENLRGSKLLPGMIESAKKEAAEEEAADKIPRDVPQKPGTMKVSKRGMLFTMENIALDPRAKFRWCVDLMIHSLDRFAGNMEKNLKSLPGDWLVSEKTPKEHRQSAPEEKS